MIFLLLIFLNHFIAQVSQFSLFIVHSSFMSSFNVYRNCKRIFPQKMRNAKRIRGNRPFKRLQTFSYCTKCCFMTTRSNHSFANVNCNLSRLLLFFSKRGEKECILDKNRSALAVKSFSKSYFENCFEITDSIKINRPGHNICM